MRNISSHLNKFKPLSLDQVSPQNAPDWMVKLLALTWFIGMGFLFWIYSITDIELSQTAKWFAFFALVFTLVPYRIMYQMIPVDYYFMLVINTIGFGPFFTSLFLMLNLIFANHTVTERVRISHFHLGKDAFNQKDVVIHLENKALSNTIKFRSFSSEVYYSDINESNYFNYTIKQGLFGYDVMSDFNFE